MILFFVDCARGRLLRVQLDDELFIELDLHQLFALWRATILASQRITVDLEPGRTRAHGRWHRGKQEWWVVAALLAHFDDIAGFHGVGRNVHFRAVHLDVTMADQLAALGAAGGDAHPVDDVIQAALESTEQVFAGNTLLTRGLFK